MSLILSISLISCITLSVDLSFVVSVVPVCPSSFCSVNCLLFCLLFSYQLLVLYIICSVVHSIICLFVFLYIVLSILHSVCLELCEPTCSWAPCLFLELAMMMNQSLCL